MGEVTPNNNDIDIVITDLKGKCNDNDIDIEEKQYSGCNTFLEGRLCIKNPQDRMAQ